MIYKNIDLTEALMSNVEQEAAEAFIDMRIDKKKKLTQRAFNQNMQKAALLEQAGVCTATEAVDLATDKCWQGITPEYVKAELSRRSQAEMQANLNQSQNLTKNQSLAQDLTDRSWAAPTVTPNNYLN